MNPPDAVLFSMDAGFGWKEIMAILTTFWKTILWAGVVLLLSLGAGDTLPQPRWLMFPHIDKAFHFLLYFVFAFLVIYDLKHSGKRRRPHDGNKIILRSVLIVILWGGMMELLQQIPVIRRDCSIFDFLANAAGAVTAAFAYRILEPLLDKIDRRL